LPFVFLLLFYSCFVPVFSHVVSSLTYPNILGNKRLLSVGDHDELQSLKPGSRYPNLVAIRVACWTSLSVLLSRP
jgi:hypothetical protein